MPVKKEDLFAKVEGIQQVGPGRYTSDCPAHNSRSGTALSILEVDDSEVVTHCFAGCEFEEILEAVGLSKGSSKNGSKTKVYKEDDLSAGEYFGFESPVGEVLYMQRHKGAFYRPVGEGLWVNNLHGVTKVLYNLPTILKASATRQILFHVEGCKDVESLATLELVATTSGGVKTWQSGFRHFYAGADVVILPDNDAEGMEYALLVASEVFSVAKSLKVVPLPDLPEKGDVSDWLEAGGTKEELLRLVEEAPYFAPETEEPWTTPVELDTGLPPVKPLDKVILPAALQGWTFDVAYRMDNAPPDFAGAASVVLCGSVLGRRVSIRPKRHDDWTVMPNLYGALIGLPASMKTPTLEQIIKPLKKLAAAAMEEYQKALDEHELDAMVAKAQREALRKKMNETARAVANNEAQPEDLEKVKEEVKELDPPEKPVELRFSTNDCTIERLAEILADNPDGVLVYRDELVGWLRNLDKPGRESDRAFFLEGWNGNTTFDSDRIGRGRVFVEALCLSLLGGIQPGPLKNYVREAAEDSDKADGLLQRFQMSVWPDTKGFDPVDQWPNKEARDVAYDAIQKLSHLNPSEFGAVTDEDGEVPYLRFAPEAQEVFDSWRKEFEPRYSNGHLHHAIESHFMKYRSLFASLALVFEALDFVVEVEGAGGVISKRSALRAAAWCSYLETHALRLYSPLLMMNLQSAQDLLEHVEAGDVTHRMKTRDIWKKGWSRLSTPEELHEALETLQEHGWVRVQQLKPPGRGRRSEVVYLHPDLRGSE